MLESGSSLPFSVNNPQQPSFDSSIPRLTSLLIDADVLNGPLQPAAIMIQAGHFDEAHHLLLDLSSRVTDDPNLWLLLAWTAPTASAAIEYYRLCLNLDPYNDLARLGIRSALVALRQAAGLGSFAGYPPDLSGEHLQNISASHLPDTSTRPMPDLSADHLPDASANHLPDTSTRPMVDLSGDHLPDASACHQPGCPLTESAPAQAVDLQQSYADFRRSRQAAFPSSIHRLAHLPFYQIILLYLFFFAIAESLTILSKPLLGIGAPGILMVLLFIQASFSRFRTRRSFLSSLALAPLMRLLILTMPLTGFQFSYWYAIISLPLLLTVYLVYRVTGYKPADVGLSTRKLPIQFVIGVIGLALGWVEYRILTPSPLVLSSRLQDLLIATFILLIFSGFLEELIYRGLIQCSADDVLGKFGIYYVSLLYALLHIGNHSLVDFGFALFVGLTFALIVKRTGSIWGVSLAHGLANLSLYILMPSGLFLPPG